MCHPSGGSGSAQEVSHRLAREKSEGEHRLGREGGEEEGEGRAMLYYAHVESEDLCPTG